MSSGYTIRRRVPQRFDEVLPRVMDALTAQGFGILSEIDVAAKMKEKLDRDMRPYRILGACAPALAWDALQAVPDVGVFLPCNVCVYEDADGGTVVSAMDPTPVVAIVDDPTVTRVASEARERIHQALESL